ncbi:MAG: TetR/AcrR family transcriptional regulator [Pseudomonadales bacterium]|nr:TetR/AcrR family transcriptional regulator [Pseudomonadales bacterium]
MNKDFWKDEVPADSRRERRKQEIRAKIIESAIDLFENEGLDETTLEHICERADISRPTFYSYYSSKQELIQALAEKLWLNVATDLTSASIEKHESTQDYIQSFMKLTRLEIIKYGRLERELVRHSMTRGSEAESQNTLMLRAMNAMFSAVYGVGKKRGDVGSRYPIDFLAETSVGCISSVMVNWALEADYPIEKRLKQTADLLIQMISLDK